MSHWPLIQDDIQDETWDDIQDDTQDDTQDDIQNKRFQGLSKDDFKGNFNCL